MKFKNMFSPIQIGPMTVKEPFRSTTNGKQLCKNRWNMER